MAVPEPAEPILPGINFFDTATIGGESVGGANTSNTGKAHPEVFAAIAPMGAASGSMVEGFDSETYDLITVEDYTTMPADMMFNADWWGYAAMTYDEFVAAAGVYEIPAFDPCLTAD